MRAMLFLVLSLFFVIPQAEGLPGVKKTWEVDTVRLMDATENEVAFAELYWKISWHRAEVTDIRGERLSLQDLKRLIPCPAEVWIEEGKEPVVRKIKVLQKVESEKSKREVERNF